jgi:hypothetical protein
MVWVVSVGVTVMVSFFTTVVESVVDVEVPDPQAAKLAIIIRNASFFMLKCLSLIPVLAKGNPPVNYFFREKVNGFAGRLHGPSP